MILRVTGWWSRFARGRVSYVERSPVGWAMEFKGRWHREEDI